MHLDTERRFAEQLIQRGLVDARTIERVRAERGRLTGARRAPSLARLLCDARALESSAARSLLRDMRRERASRGVAGSTPPPLGLDSPPLMIRLDSSSASVPDAPPGAVVLRRRDRVGPYEIKDELGRGGMGVVYHAIDTRLGREVALKTLIGRLTPDRVERFRREGRALARIQHPNVVTIFEADVHDGVPVTALELVHGGSLQQALAFDGPLEPRRAAAIVRDLAAGVQAAHELGIIHRDIKPANVLLEPSGRPRLTDFGLARDARDTTITASGEILGTPHYMAPEQILGCSELIDARTDIYALGGVLYATLTARPPFVALTGAELARLVVSSDPESPSRHRRELGIETAPAALEAICFKALAKSPADRYASAAALGRDLEAWLGGGPVSAMALGDRLRRRAGRLGRAALALVGIAGAAIVVASFVSSAPGSSRPPEPHDPRGALAPKTPPPPATPGARDVASLGADALLEGADVALWTERDSSRAIDWATRVLKLGVRASNEQRTHALVTRALADLERGELLETMEDADAALELDGKEPLARLAHSVARNELEGRGTASQDPGALRELSALVPKRKAEAVRSWLPSEARAVAVRASLAHHARIRIAFDRGEGALDALDPVIAARPRFARARILRGRLCCERGLLDEAVRRGEETASFEGLSNRNASECEQVIGRALALRGARDTAFAHLDRAIELARSATAELHDALLVRARAHLLWSDGRRAIEDAKEALTARSSDEGKAIIALGHALLRQDSAAKTWLELAAGPKVEELWEAKVVLALRAGEIGTAAEACEEACKHGPARFEPFLLRCSVRLARADLPGALEDAERACALAPGVPRVVLVRAKVFSAMGDNTRAREGLRRFIELADRQHPNHADATRVLALMEGR